VNRGPPRSLLKLVPPSRETDEQAIEALCFFLDRAEVGEPSGLGSRSGLEGTRGELWSTILRRRIIDTYKPTGTAPQWQHRHFHFRRIMTDETDDQAAAHVARIWNRQATTIATHAKRKRQKARALRWVGNVIASWRREYPNKSRLPDSLIVRALEKLMWQKAAEFSDHKKVKRDTAKSR
jgi:hypothetical protein